MTTQTKVRRLIQQLEEVYDGKPWYGTAVKPSLAKVNPALAKESLLPNKKNIAKILRHMVAWRQYLIEHIKGNQSYRIEINSPVDWPPVEGLSWAELVQELETSQTQLLQLLSQQEDAWLQQTVDGKKYSFLVLVEGIIQHDVYHLGQINLLNG